MNINTKTDDYIDITDIQPFTCIKPKFKDQIVINESGRTFLDKNNSIIVSYDVLNDNYLHDFIVNACKVERFSGKSIFNSIKPRKEVCYSVDGEIYRYSRIIHKTMKYPDHIMNIIPIFLSTINQYIESNIYTNLSHGVDIIYGPDFKRGGSMGAHSDDEENWGLVIIYSLGQSRWLRIRRKSDLKWYNVEMRHNSLLAMHGYDFQKKYTHQVDKLSMNEPVYIRLSCNMRFS